MSTIDSQEILKIGRPAFSAGHRQILLWWVLAFTGAMIAAAGLFIYIKDLPPLILRSESWMILGGLVLTLSFAGVLDRSGVVHIWNSRRSRALQVRLRIESYYRRGQDLYIRLESDAGIDPEDVRRIVATEWVNPVTEYLRATVGDRQAAEFLCVAQSTEPEEESIRKMGYPKALARVRLLDRLERLRTTLLEVR